MRKHEGITLIALVVTIIILIILAGVSINLILGNNSLIYISKKTAHDYTNSTYDEEEKLNNLFEEMEDILNGNSTNVKYIIDINKEYNEEVFNGHSCLSPKTFTPYKEGYEFIGWREDNNASSEVLSEKNVHKDEEIILYAVFKKDIKINYNDNYATSGTMEQDVKSLYYNNGNGETSAQFTIANNEFIRENEEFKEWKLDEENKYYPGDTINLSQDITLNACWKLWLIKNGVRQSNNMNAWGKLSGTYFSASYTDSTSTFNFTSTQAYTGTAYINSYNTIYNSGKKVNISDKKKMYVDVIGTSTKGNNSTGHYGPGLIFYIMKDGEILKEMTEIYVNSAGPTTFSKELDLSTITVDKTEIYLGLYGRIYSSGNTATMKIKNLYFE